MKEEIIGTEDEKKESGHEGASKRRASVAVGLLFLLLIFGTTVASLAAPDVSFSDNENRFLAKRPEFSSEALFSGAFTKDYETYLTDQFIWRNYWIGVKTISERLLLKQDINGVYFAKDGYYIEKIDSTDVDSEQLSKNESRLVEFLDYNRELLGEDHVFALLAPTAFVALSDKLPPFATSFDQDRLLDRLSKKTGNSWVETRNVLKSHSSDYIYYKTDHHWTTLGAYYAYYEWAKKSGLTPWELEEFNVKRVSQDFYGTIYSKINLPVKPDDIYIFDSNKSYTVTYNYNYDMNGKPITPEQTLYDLERLRTKDKYTVFLKGNNSLVEIETDVDNDRRLLIIKDSFAHCFAPFAVNHFEKTYMIDFRYFNMPVSQFIKENNITDILVLYNAVSFAKDKNTFSFTK